MAAKNLIKASFKGSLRAKGDPARQLSRGDAGIRQLINGLFDYSEIALDADAQNAYKAYLHAKEKLRSEIEKEVYRLGILMQFSEDSDDNGEINDSSLKNGIGNA